VTLLLEYLVLIAIYFILENHYYLAGFLFVLKSGIDAADGELADKKTRPLTPADTLIVCLTSFKFFHFNH
jgi:hypothetical protein